MTERKAEYKNEDWTARPHPVPHPVTGQLDAECWWVDTPHGKIQVSMPNAEAVARRISASQELLDAVVAAREAMLEATQDMGYFGQTSFHMGDGPVFDESDEIIQQMDAAIAKAKGD